MKLEGKVALITGAGRGGRGIGRSIAMELAHEGADIVITDYIPENADAVAEEVKTTGRRALAIQGNVAVWSDVENIFAKAMETFGCVDILVNNAGITKDNLILRMSEEDWDAVVDINLKGTFLCTKAASKIFLKRKSGKIVNVASVMGIVGNAGQANYSASKGGIIALTKTTAKELGSRGITVNAVAPGFIQTAMTDQLSDEVRERMKRQVPLARLGTPEDVAKVALFLCASDSDYVTGQVISIDGGLFM